MKSEVTVDTSMMQHTDQLKQKTLKTVWLVGQVITQILCWKSSHTEVQYEPAQDYDGFLSAIYSLRGF